LSIMASAVALVMSTKAVICTELKVVAIRVFFDEHGLGLRLVLGDAVLCRVTQLLLLAVAGMVPAVACRHWGWTDGYGGSSLCRLVVPVFVMWAAALGNTGLESLIVIGVFSRGAKLGGVFSRIMICLGVLLYWTASYDYLIVFGFLLCVGAPAVHVLQKFWKKKKRDRIVVEEWPEYGRPSIKWWIKAVVATFVSECGGVPLVGPVNLENNYADAGGHSFGGRMYYEALSDLCVCGGLGVPEIGDAGEGLMPVDAYESTAMAKGGGFQYALWVTDMCGDRDLTLAAQKCVTVVMESSHEWAGSAREFRKLMALLGDALLRVRMVTSTLQVSGVTPGDVGSVVGSKLSNKTMLRAMQGMPWYQKFVEVSHGGGEKAVGTRFEAVVGICYMDAMNRGGIGATVLDCALNVLDVA